MTLPLKKALCLLQSFFQGYARSPPQDTCRPCVGHARSGFLSRHSRKSPRLVLGTHHPLRRPEEFSNRSLTTRRHVHNPYVLFCPCGHKGLCDITHVHKVTRLLSVPRDKDGLLTQETREKNRCSAPLNSSFRNLTRAIDVRQTQGNVRKIENLVVVIEIELFGTFRHTIGRLGTDVVCLARTLQVTRVHDAA